MHKNWKDVKAKMQEVFQYTLEGVVQLFIIDQEIEWSNLNMN